MRYTEGDVYHITYWTPQYQRLLTPDMLNWHVKMVYVHCELRHVSRFKPHDVAQLGVLSCAKHINADKNIFIEIARYMESANHKRMDRVLFQLKLFFNDNAFEIYADGMEYCVGRKSAKFSIAGRWPPPLTGMDHDSYMVYVMSWATEWIAQDKLYRDTLPIMYDHYSILPKPLKYYLLSLTA